MPFSNSDFLLDKFDILAEIANLIELVGISFRKNRERQEKIFVTSKNFQNCQKNCLIVF